MAKKKADEKINLDTILFKYRDILSQARNSGSFFEKRDMMLTLFFLRFIGEKFEDGIENLRQQLMRLQEQDDWVATWSKSMVTNLKQVLQKILVENEYPDIIDADHLNHVLIRPLLEKAIRASGQELALPTVNYLNREGA